MRPRAFIFCVKQCLVSPFIIPANRDPGVQIGHTVGFVFKLLLCHAVPYSEYLSPCDNYTSAADCQQQYDVH